MEHRFLVLPIRSLEIVLTELPGAHDSLQIPFIGWLWPVARCTGSLFYLPNVATFHRLHKHTVVKFHLLPFSFSLSLHSTAVCFFFCYTVFYLFGVHFFQFSVILLLLTRTKLYRRLNKIHSIAKRL
jgi:hypothetical protein